jgi:hypothetical protein
MRGQSSRGFDRQNAFFRPIEDDEMACSSSSPSAASSPVSFWASTTSTTATKYNQAGSGEDALLAALHEEALKDRERMKLINELILSERDYVQDLEAINSVRRPPSPPLRSFSIFSSRPRLARESNDRAIRANIFTSIESN